MTIDTVWTVVTVPTAKFEAKLAKERLELEDFYYIRNLDENGNDDIYGTNTMESILTDALIELHITDVVWIPTRSGSYWHVYFPVELSNNDYTIYYLKKQGIGTRCNSSLGYIPFNMYLYNEKVEENDDFNKSYIGRVKKSFLRSVTSRLTVAQVVDGVVAGAQPTFDYWIYLITSCMIACMGIMNTSPIDVAASMMIEPLMGAVICVAFGLAIHNWSVMVVGFKSLVYGDIFCVVFGFCFAGVFLCWRVAWNPPPDGAWPTPEMQSRGEYKTLIYGAVIASAGGACLAVVLLQNNLVALTGVAVATTFMPPLVNVGICWALACHIQASGIGEPWHSYNFSGKIYVLRDAYIPKGDYNPDWSYDIRVECLVLGAISLAYHFINVFFLFTFGFLVLKMKCIMPLRYITTSERKFFREDIQAYKDHLRKYSTDEDMGQRILEEWADLVGVDKKGLMRNTPQARVTQLQTLYDIAKDVEENPNYQSLTRNAIGNKYQQHLKRRLTRPTLVDDEVEDDDGVVVHMNDDAKIGNNNSQNNKNIYTLDATAIDNLGFVNDSNEHLTTSNIPRSLRRSSRNSIFSLWPSNDPILETMPNNARTLNVPPYLRNRSRSTISALSINKRNNF